MSVLKVQTMAFNQNILHYVSLSDILVTSSFCVSGFFSLGSSSVTRFLGHFVVVATHY